jgi:hypothetical protein
VVIAAPFCLNNMMKKICIYIFTLLSFSATAQKNIFTDSVVIESKMWSRDSLRKIQYSGWTSFSSHTVDMLRGFDAGNKTTLSKYGGDISIQKKATGFFRTEKINNRWFIIDPLGHPFISTGVTSFRQGKSPDNISFFEKKYGSTENWVKSSAEIFFENGFNTAGSWSDVDGIRHFNKTAEMPLPYSTQLNLLSGYVREAIKKNPERNGLSPLLFITDKEFADFCNEETKKLIASKDDANLLGHFSDNEIAFTRTELKNIVDEKNKFERNYQPLLNWLSEKKYDINNLNKEQGDELMGWLTGIYFKTVFSAIKKNDPNHLYIGSRLHSNAKNNKYIFKAAEPFIDIISINYYGYWQPQDNHIAEWAAWSSKPFFITEFYTKAEDSGLPNISGAGWLVKTQNDRAIHYQNFCLQLLIAKNCVGWHWFRYQDNDPKDPTADPSNNDSNKGIVNTQYELYKQLTEKMKQLNDNKYRLIKYFDYKNQ